MAPALSGQQLLHRCANLKGTFDGSIVPTDYGNVGIGYAVARLEDERLLPGGGHYVSD